MKERIQKNIYNPNEIEKKWQEKWTNQKLYSPNLDRAKNPFYNLMMFPYPSAEGLHVGNMYAFTGADIYARFNRMLGKDVFEPIGLDGFGIHSENYAIKVGRTPQEHSKISQENFYKQLHKIGNAFDWTRSLETYDPSYYKWTQWLFIQLFKAGLAYRKKAPVNYCPKDKTVLSDEQVENGKCERCGTKVEKRNVEQWFFKITKYADRLLKNIPSLNWSEKVKIAQENWIGKSQGAQIRFQVVNTKDDYIEVFTTRPDTLYGVTFLALAPENPIAQTIDNDNVRMYFHEVIAKSEEERISESSEKTGVFTDIYAIHPITKHKIPVWVADYVLPQHGTGAIMGVPAHDKRDYEFAKKFDLPIKEVITAESSGSEQIDEANSLSNQSFNQYNEKNVSSKKQKISLYESKNGTIINSEDWSGLSMPENMDIIFQSIEKKGIGHEKSIYHLRDWLISRQRYWGPPIPMIHCSECGWQTVPEDQLPVLLPTLKDWKPTGEGKGPLAQLKDWVRVRCPKCDKEAQRETDVSDSFLDSSWYFFRYLATELNSIPFPSEKFLENKSTQISKTEETIKKAFQRTSHWLPVNTYIGGAEHSVLHLLYARFITMFLHDQNYINFEEPFSRFYAHGLIIKDGAKMSKSKGNIIVPDVYIKKYGADTLRAYLAFIGPFSQGGDFSDAGIEGMNRFIKKIYRLVIDNLKTAENQIEQENLKDMHKTIKKVTEEISELRYNTAIAAMMEYYNTISKHNKIYQQEIHTILKLLAPIMPHITEELWQQMPSSADMYPTKPKTVVSIHTSSWPTYDEKYLIENSLIIAVQIDGKLRMTIQIPSFKIGDQQHIESLVISDAKIAGYLAERQIKKTVYVEGKIINLVTK